MSTLKNLPLAEKADILLHHGKPVTSFKINGITSALYVLDGDYHYRYVEVIMSKSCHIIDIRQLETAQLDKYLQEVVLSKVG